MKKNPPKMLITGVSGMLGGALACWFRNDYQILGSYHSRPVEMEGLRTVKADVTDAGEMHSLIREFKPAVVIHCAAFTSVDGCEAHPEKAYSINVEGVRSVVHAADSLETFLVYISTDAIYPGTVPLNSETTTPAPHNHYGRTKFEGEKVIRETPKWLILRTNIFGWNGSGKMMLAEWILNNLQTGTKFTGFKDAFFSIIYTMELCRVLASCLQSGLTGLYNCGSRNSCSKYDFAVKLADRFGYDRDLVVPGSIDDQHHVAIRGKSLGLQVEKIEKALGWPMPLIDDCIELFHRDYHADLQKRIWV